MRKKILISAFFIASFSLSACGNQNTNSSSAYSTSSISTSSDSSLSSSQAENANAPIYTGMSIDSGRLLPKRRGADNYIAKDITTIVDISGTEADDKNDYYVEKGKDFIVSIHFSNPELYEIQSFTLNNQKYSNYMFEKGSTMELILIKMDAPMESGFFEITIDAVKYIDDVTIKNVKMSGEKTIKYGVSYDNLPSITNMVVNPSTTSASCSFVLEDTNDLAEKDSLLLYLSDGEKVVDQKSIAVGRNDITFTNLLMDKKYQYGMVATFNGANEKGRHTEWIATNMFDTLQPYTIDNAVALENDITFNINTIDSSATITSIELLELNDSGNPVVAATGNSETRSFSNLKAEQFYQITINYSYTFNAETITNFVATSLRTDAKTYAVKYLDENGDVLYESRYKRFDNPVYLGRDIDDLKNTGAGLESQYYWNLESGTVGSSDCVYRLVYNVRTIGLELFEGSATSYNGSNTCVIIPTEWDGLRITSIGQGAFRGCSSLISITIPNSITSISNNAFEGCSSLTSITIGNSVTSIGQGAFRGCSSLTTITIPDSITSIGYEAFQGCSSLKNTYIKISSIEDYLAIDGKTNIKGDIHLLDDNNNEITKAIIPNSVTSIEYNDFYNFTSLTSIVIPDSVTSIGYHAFYGCSSLTSIVIPDSVTSISSGAFEGCSSLESITLPFVGYSQSKSQFLGSIFGASKYSENSNYVPTSLKTVVLSNACTSIAESAFYGCSSLTSITIGNSVTSIGQGAFRGCSSLTTITIPDSVTSIGNNAFKGCSSLASIGVSIENDNYSSVNGVLYNKDQTMLIYYPSEETSIVIPNSVTSISSGAFEGCSSLESITLPFVGGSATSNQFLGYIFGASKYSENSNYVPTSLKTVVLSNACTSIAESAFRGCSSLTSITIPDSVISIGQGAFYGCSSLESITLPFVGGSATSNQFLGYIFGAYNTSESSVSQYVPTSLKTVILSSSFTSFSANAFAYCPSLINIEVSDENQQYSSVDGALYNKNQTQLIWCPQGKTSITIPDSVTSISNYAFTNCSSLISINASDENQQYSSADGVLYNKDQTTLIRCPQGKTSITIPDSVTSIGNNAFTNCSSLSSIVIPNSVTSIGNNAFTNCSSLSSIVIPNSVTSLGESAFSKCNSLETLFYYGTSNEWEQLNFVVPGNEPLLSATAYFYSESTPIDDGNYWHYINGVPTIW